MKIVCEACQAKYSISDDKVRGKAFKIRCKKCSNIIVVKPNEGGISGPQADATTIAPASGAGDTTWHIVVDGEQVGPLSDGDIRGRLSRGEINGDTYIWREGLADWQKISAVADFADAVGGRRSARMSASVAPLAAAAPHSPFDGGGAEPDVFAAPTVVAASGGADLFGSPVKASPVREPAPMAASFSFGGGGGASESYGGRGGNGAAAAAAAPSGSGMTGQRHENSVLFSLSNLEALAQPNSSSPAAPRPGVSASNTEGSGLIDIRSMAASTLRARPDDFSGSSDLPAFGAPQFSAAAPVLLPFAQSSGPPKWLFAVLGILVVLAGGLGIATYKIFTSRAAPVALPAPTPAPAPPKTAAPAPAPEPAASPPTTPPPATNEALPPREEKAEKTAVKTADKPSDRKHRGGSPSRPPETASAAPPSETTKPEPKPEPEKPAAKLDKLDELLQSATGGGKPKATTAPREDEPAPKKPAAAEKTDLPALEKGDIVKAMMGLSGRIKGCYEQYKVPGMAMVKINVGRGGKVSGAAVSGKFAGTPTGNCVETAVKSAKFPPVDATNFDYPFSLR